MRVRRWLGRALLGLAVLLALAQLVRPARTNPHADPTLALESRLPVEAAARSVLDRACLDCHSNDTTWPWYSQVAPASWLLVADVHEGRKALNFSEWGAYPPGRQAKLLAESCGEVREGEMPPWSYRLAHPVSRLQPEDVEALCRWAEGARQPLGQR